MGDVLVDRRFNPPNDDTLLRLHLVEVKQLHHDKLLSGLLESNASLAENQKQTEIVMMQINESLKKQEAIGIEIVNKIPDIELLEDFLVNYFGKVRTVGEAAIILKNFVKEWWPIILSLMTGFVLTVWYIIHQAITK